MKVKTPSFKRILKVPVEDIQVTWVVLSDKCEQGLRKAICDVVSTFGQMEGNAEHLKHLFYFQFLDTMIKLFCLQG